MSLKPIASSYACLACLLLPCCLVMLTGCNGASAAPAAASAEQARTALTATLEAWKNGEAYSGHLASNTGMQVADEDWLTGTKLEDFQLGEESTTVVAGPSRLWPVVLKVRDARGKTVARKVAYQVTGSPQISVVRQD